MCKIWTKNFGGKYQKTPGGIFLTHTVTLSRTCSWSCYFITYIYVSSLTCLLVLFRLNAIITFLPFLLYCTALPRLCSRSITFHNVHYPLSSLISSFGLNHSLYADDAQLFFSFHPCDFDSSITRLEVVLNIFLLG